MRSPLDLRGCTVTVIATGIIYSNAAAQCPIEITSFVHAADNALVDGSWATYWPSGNAVPITVSASGSAFAAPDVEFGSVIVNYRRGNRDAVYHVLPKGGVIQITDYYPEDVKLWFSDDEASDNSGHFVLTFIPNVGSPEVVTVDPTIHCFLEQQALTFELPSKFMCTAEATGTATFAGPENRYATVAMTYISDTVPPRKLYAAIETGSGPVDITGVTRGPVSLFFTDTYAGDNEGGFQVLFRLDEIVPAASLTWGQVKVRWLGVQ